MGTCPIWTGKYAKKGFVLKLGTKANIDPDRIKELTEIISDDNSSDKTRIALAVWMYREYGGNLIQSLRVVMPARKMYVRSR